MRRSHGIIVGSLLLATVAHADPDAITLAGRPYLRWQFEPSGDTPPQEGGVVGKGNAVTLFAHGGPFATNYARVRNLDSWVRDCHPVIPIDQTEAVRCWGMMCTRTTTHSIFIWERNGEDPPVYLRAFDNLTGTPAAASRSMSSINDAVLNQMWEIDTNAGNTVACYYGYLGSWSGPFGLVFQRLNADGSPLASAQTVQLSPFQGAILSVRPDGSFFGKYLRLSPLGVSTLFELRIDANDAVTQETQVPDFSWREIEQADGTFLQIRNSNGSSQGTSYVQRVDINNQQLAQPQYTIPPRCVAVGGVPDGRFATLHANGGTDMRLQLYGSDWQPIGTPELFIRPELGGIYSTSLATEAVAYLDDGTIWVFWRTGNNARVTVLKPFVAGDLNGDGALNNFDIDPFVLALVDPAAYQATYNLPAGALGDFDGDGQLTNFDIDPFVDALLSLPP